MFLREDVKKKGCEEVGGNGGDLISTFLNRTYGELKGKRPGTI